MNIRPAARAIVLKDGKMLIMKRTKPGRKYMVTPGGRIEDGEKPEETVLREVLEETTVEVSNPRLVFVEEPNDGVWGTQYIYICDYVSGEPKLNPDSEEYQYQKMGYGTYEPLWLVYSELDNSEYPLKSARLGDEIRQALKDGFPDTPKHWAL